MRYLLFCFSTVTISQFAWSYHMYWSINTHLLATSTCLHVLFHFVSNIWVEKLIIYQSWVLLPERYGNTVLRSWLLAAWCVLCRAGGVCWAGCECCGFHVVLGHRRANEQTHLFLFPLCAWNKSDEVWQPRIGLHTSETNRAQKKEQRFLLGLFVNCYC